MTESLRFVGIKNAEELISDHYDRELRDAADHLEEGWFSDSMEEAGITEADRKQMAALLRAKADIIQAARDSVRKEFSAQGLDQLLDAISKTFSHDTGPDAIAEAWDQYGEIQ